MSIFGHHRALRSEPPLDPPEDPATVECPECGGEAEIIPHRSGRRGGVWWYRAECACGHIIEEDNI